MSLKWPWAPKPKASKGGHTHDDDRAPHALHAVGNTTDDHRGGARHGLVSQFLGGSVLVAGRILGPLANTPTRGQTDDHAERYGPEIRHQEVREDHGQDGNGDAGTIDAAGQSLQQRALVGVLFCLDEEDAPDRKGDAGRPPGPLAGTGRQVASQGSSCLPEPILRWRRRQRPRPPWRESNRNRDS